MNKFFSDTSLTLPRLWSIPCHFPTAAKFHNISRILDKWSLCIVLQMSHQLCQFCLHHKHYKKLHNSLQSSHQVIFTNWAPLQSLWTNITTSNAQTKLTWSFTEIIRCTTDILPPNVAEVLYQKFYYWIEVWSWKSHIQQFARWKYYEYIQQIIIALMVAINGTGDIRDIPRWQMVLVY